MLGLFGVFGGFMMIWFFLLVFASVFWLWMLIDCLKRRKFEDKLVWVVVLTMLNVIGAILYYFLVKSKD